LEYTTSFIDYRMFSHNFTDDLPGTKIYIPWQGTGEQTSVPESRASFLAPFDMTCHKIMIKIPEIATAATDIVFTIEKTAEGDLAPSTVCTFDFTDSFVDDSVVTINRSDWNADPTVPAKSIIYIGMNPDNANITDAEREFIITSVWKTIVTI